MAHFFLLDSNSERTDLNAFRRLHSVFDVFLVAACSRSFILKLLSEGFKTCVLSFEEFINDQAKLTSRIYLAQLKKSEKDRMNVPRAAMRSKSRSHFIKHLTQNIKKIRTLKLRNQLRCSVNGRTLFLLSSYLQNTLINDSLHHSLEPNTFWFTISARVFKRPANR